MGLSNAIFFLKLFLKTRISVKGREYAEDKLHGF